MLHSIPRPTENVARAVRVAGHPMKGTHMSENNTPVAAVVATAPTAIRESVLSQIRYFEAQGYDLEALTVAELLEVQAQFYAEWQASDVRKAERDARRAIAEAKAKAARAERDAAKKARLAAQKAQLEAKLKAMAAETE